MRIFVLFFTFCSTLFFAQNTAKKEILVRFDAKVINDSIIEAQLINMSKDSLKYHMLTEYFVMIQEAKNKQGKWMPTEFYIYPSCYIGGSKINIASNEIYSQKKYYTKGSFKTEARLKFLFNQKVYYSPSYIQYVNPENFELKGMKERYSPFLQYHGEKITYEMATLNAESTRELFRKEMERQNQFLEKVKKRNEKNNQKQ